MRIAPIDGASERLCSEQAIEQGRGRAACQSDAKGSLRLCAESDEPIGGVSAEADLIGQDDDFGGVVQSSNLLSRSEA
jgi:hypothetical protein